MSDKQPTRARGTTTTERFVTIYNQDRFGVTLDDLRKLVDLAEDVSGEAEVLLEDVSPHYLLIDRKTAQRISVRHRE